jgi:hypothetical protein
VRKGQWLLYIRWALVQKNGTPRKHGACLSIDPSFALGQRGYRRETIFLAVSHYNSLIAARQQAAACVPSAKQICRMANVQHEQSEALQVTARKETRVLILWRNGPFAFLARNLPYQAAKSLGQKKAPSNLPPSVIVNVRVSLALGFNVRRWCWIDICNRTNHGLPCRTHHVHAKRKPCQRTAQLVIFERK